MEKGGRICPVKVVKDKKNVEKLDELLAKVVRSWNFIIFQFAFIVVWIGLNHNHPSWAWDDASYSLLRLVLTIESSFIGSILLMHQHRQSEKDRTVIYNDYILDLLIKKDLKEIKPLIKKIHDSLNKE